MTEAVKLFGFGSFFSNEASVPRDVDILILHERVDPASIDFAIRCKSVLSGLIRGAHIVILSECEERELVFLQRSNGKMLGRVTNADLGMQLENLASAICRSRPDRLIVSLQEAVH